MVATIMNGSRKSGAVKPSLNVKRVSNYPQLAAVRGPYQRYIMQIWDTNPKPIEVFIALDESERGVIFD